MDYDALERLVRLRDQGALSAEEFAEQKRILLAGPDGGFKPLTNELEARSGYLTLQKSGAVAFVIGLCAVIYSTFFYDTTISPMDAASRYSSVDEYSSLEDRARAVSDIADRYERTVAGERIINFPRVEEQRRVFSFGALLMVLGAIGFVVPLVRNRRREMQDD